MKWIARLSLLLVGSAVAVFFVSFVYFLIAGRSIGNAFGAAALVLAIVVDTPISIITSGRLPYIET